MVYHRLKTSLSFVSVWRCPEHKIYIFFVQIVMLVYVAVYAPLNYVRSQNQKYRFSGDMTDRYMFSVNSEKENQRVAVYDR